MTARLLDFTLGFSPGQDTEFVLIDNDQTDVINGRLRTLIGVDGSLLPAARTLNEGDLVFDISSGASEAAYITYFGGDGNDVAIVMGGDVTIESQGVTLISRNGSNLEIRVGATLAAAQAAGPTVRPIAGLNGNDLRINGIAASNDELYVDVDRFIDPQGINFDGTIVFAGNEGTGDQDRLVVFDSDLSTNDDADTITYTSLAVPELGSMAINPFGSSPDIVIDYSGTELLDQLIDANHIDLTLSVRAETLLIDQVAGSPNRNQIQTILETTPGTLFTIPNPEQLFSISSGSGNDAVAINGLSSSFSAAIDINSASGLDSIVVNTPLSLGSANVTGDLDLSAESVQILQSVDTTGGLTDGTVTIDGGNQVVVSAAVSTGNAPISIDGNDGTIDTASGTLQSLNSIVIRDATDIVLGNVDIAGATLTLGVDRDITGAVTQAAGTSVVASRLTASTNGSIDLPEPANRFDAVDGISADGRVLIVDGAGDLQLFGVDSGGNDIIISTVGSAILQTVIQSPGATVQINAGQAIVDFAPADTSAKITADRVILTAGSGGIGQTGALEIDADVLSIDTSAGNGNVHVTNPFGSLRIDQVSAGSGVVKLSANQLDDATDDTLSDFTASRLELTAMTGIGSVRPLELTSVQRLSAQTDSGGINLDWTAAGNTVVERLVAGSGGIALTQRGGSTLDIEVLENQSGLVNIISEDGSIDIASGPQISAETIRIEADRDLSIDRSIRTIAGALNLFSNETITLTGDLDTTAATVSGALSINSPSIIFSDADLVSAGGDITVDGILTIEGESRIDSGNQQAALAGGDVEFTQSIRGAGSGGDRLLIDARGSNTNGNVTIGGPVGATGGSVGSPDINALEIDANVITIDSVGVTGGDIRLTGAQVNLTGNEVRTSISGDIDIDGPLTVPAGETAITAAGSALLRSDVVGDGNTSVLTITAVEDVLVNGNVGGLVEFSIAAGATSELRGSVAVTGDITLDGQSIELFAPLIITPELIVFAGDVTFKADALVDSGRVRFDGAAIIDRLVTSEISGSIIDSPVASQLVKSGEGTLVLTGNSPFTQGTQITAGTLRVTGIFGSSAADVVVESGARLEGSGRIGARVVARNGGTLGPGNSETNGEDNATLFADSLDLKSG